jgi:hypothetical protein
MFSDSDGQRNVKSVNVKCKSCFTSTEPNEKSDQKHNRIHSSINKHSDAKASPLATVVKAPEGLLTIHVADLISLIGPLYQ